MRRGPTIAEVAARAGVSTTTVSHAFSGRRPVAAGTRDRVQRAVQELRYRPNGVARSLRTRRSHTVALIIPDITNPYYPALARGIQNVLAEAGYHVLVCNTDREPRYEAEYVADVLERQVDGILMSAFHLVADDLTDVFLDDVPFVAFGARIVHPGVDVVRSDDAAGARDATRHLLAAGHTRVGMISGPPGPPPSEARLAGYRRALVEADRPEVPELVVQGDFTRPGGAAAMRRIAALRERPTALFCANDLMAIGAMDAAREVGLTLPDDLALVGYDDIEAAAFLTPALTTVLNPADELGATAGRLLLERIGGYRGRRREIVIPHRLVVRDSA
jgi:LacI family transcriptional regulator, galactose operon repressor